MERAPIGALSMSSSRLDRWPTFTPPPWPDFAPPLTDGRSNKEIARELDVSEATIKAHLTGVFRKLGVTNRGQAMLAVQPLAGR